MARQYEQDLGSALEGVVLPVLDVQHGLGTEDVTVETLDEDRRPVGHYAAVPIDGGSVEVVPVPGTRYVVVTAP